VIPAVIRRRGPIRLIADGVRRRLWRAWFEAGPRRLGSFFLDAGDHIGRERLIGADRYEAANLRAIEMLASRLGGDTGIALDIGANIGNHACAFLPWFEHVLTVEPGRIASHVLEANLLASGRRNWSVARCALGAEAGQGHLRRIAPDNLGSSALGAGGEGEDEPVRIRTGDDLLAQHGLTAARVALVKLDVEGSEAAALRGLATTLARDAPLVCVEALEAPRWDELFKLLTAHGYVHFLALQSSTRGWARLLRGEEFVLKPLPDAFPPGGYDMVYCLTRSQGDRLQRAGPPG
jgi:FkbM family methyltransferase